MINLSVRQMLYFVANIVGCVFLGMALTQVSAPVFVIWVVPIVLIGGMIGCQFPTRSSEVEGWLLQAMVFAIGLFCEWVVVGFVLPLILIVFFLTLLFTFELKN